MPVHTAAFSLHTRGKGTYEITSQVEAIVRESGIRAGLATVFIRHTSASLIIYENADRSARVDLENYFNRLVPEDADYFVHTAEGPDDMPSHIRMVRPRCRWVKQQFRDRFARLEARRGSWPEVPPFHPGTALSSGGRWTRSSPAGRAGVTLPSPLFDAPAASSSAPP